MIQQRRERAQRGGPAARRGFRAQLVDPIDRQVEAIYSILLVLTFTLAVNAFDGEGAFAEHLAAGWISQLFLAAMGCAVAWGLIDGAMHVVSSQFERGEQRRLLRELRSQPDDAAGRAVVARELEDLYPALADLPEREQIYQTIFRHLAERQADPPLVRREDLAGGAAIALVAIAAALPVALPLVLLPNSPLVALRLSNLIACGLLFWLGYSWARYAGGRPWRTGLSLLVFGLAMVAIAIPLGG